MLKLAEKGHITATDFADYLVKNLNYPFRKSYQITARIVNYCDKNKKKLSELSINELKKFEPKLTEDVIKGKKSIVLTQAKNRLVAQKGILKWLSI